MTFNNVISRIMAIALAHKQVRNFYSGLVQDFTTDHTTRYPSVFLERTGGNISTDGAATTLRFRMHIMDLVHVSQDSKQNELDVQSDMISIAMDIIAQMNSGNYQDWRLSIENNLELVVEESGDMYAGVIIDFSLRIIFTQDLCQIPSDLIIIIPPDVDMKLVYDVKYVADGNEGSTLTTEGVSPMIPEINGKKILLITREYAPIYKVSALPNQTEFTWNDVIIGLGLPTIAGERFLFLYRTY